MEGTLRIGLVGCGGIAAAHVDGYRMLREAGCRHFEITAVVDTEEAAAEAIAGRIAGCQPRAPARLRSVDDLIASRPVDGVDVCTPHGDHHVTAVRCLEAGIHVMVEKPMGISLRAAARMAEAAERTGNILSIAENSRRGLGQRAMAWLFRSDRRIGDPRLFVIEHIGGPAFPLAPPGPPERPPSVPWRARKMHNGGGWTYDGGVHLMDSLLVYFGPIDSVHAVLKPDFPAYVETADGERVETACEHTCLATFRFASGVIGTWTWCSAAAGAQHMRVAFYCDRGYVVDETPGGWTHTFGGGFIPSQATVFLPDGTRQASRDLELEYLLRLDGPERERLFPHGLTGSIAVECHEFVDCIRHGRRPEVDSGAGLAALAVAASVYESNHCGQPVRVGDVAAGRIDAYQRPVDEYWGLA